MKPIDEFAKAAEPGIDIDFLKSIMNTLKERKGYIMLPSGTGFAMYEVGEERLRKYLAIEAMEAERVKREKQ